MNQHEIEEYRRWLREKHRELTGIDLHPEHEARAVEEYLALRRRQQRRRVAA